MKAYAYIRKSTDDEKNQQNSLVYQKEEIQRKFSSQYPDIEFYEESASAVKNERPVFERLYGEIKREGGVLLAWKIDRVIRNEDDLPRFLNLPSKNTIIRTVCDGDFDQSGFLQLAFRSIFAIWEPRVTKERQKAAYYSLIDKGFWPFAPPLGYSADYKVKNIKKPNKKAQAVKEIFEAFLGFKGSVEQFVTPANAILRRYKVFNKTKATIYKILVNKFYAGILVYRSEDHGYIERKGQHEPIISVKFFQKVQDKLSSNKIEKIQTHDFLYRGRIKCKCGRTLSGELQKGNVYYRCHNKKCDFKNVKEDKVHKYVAEFLEKNKLTKEGAQIYIDPLLREKDRNLTKIQDTRSWNTRRMNEITDELKKYTRMRAYDELTQEEYQVLKDDLLQEQTKLKKERDKEEKLNKQQQVLNSFEEMFELIRNKFQSWNTAKDSMRSYILILIGSNLSINSENQVQMRVYKFLEKLLDPQNAYGGLYETIFELFEEEIEVFTFTLREVKFLLQNSQ